MALGTISVQMSTLKFANDSNFQIFIGTLLASAFTDTYPATGLPLDTVLAAALGPTGPLEYVLTWSEGGSGYVYQRVASTGRMMVLQVPPSGSLTTAAPLQQ